MLAISLGYGFYSCIILKLVGIVLCEQDIIPVMLLLSMAIVGV